MRRSLCGDLTTEELVPGAGLLCIREPDCDGIEGCDGYGSVLGIGDLFDADLILALVGVAGGMYGGGTGGGG